MQYNNQYLKPLLDILKIQSISMEKAFSPEMKKARDYLAKTFKEMGFKTKILKGIKHDAFFAQRQEDKKLPTVLIYGHYDVQPADPIGEWKTNPFEPVVKNGKVYGRGATDNKGQFMAHVMAVKKLLTENPKLPVNFKFLIEGEEEMGSESIGPIAKKYGKTLLKSDVIVVSDSEMYEPNLPTIDIGLRGLCYTEIVLESGKNDVHSGQFGGVAPNPAIELSKLIARLKDDSSRVLIPGFYDKAVKLTKEELADFTALPVSAQNLMAEGGMYYVGGGEAGFTLNERRWARPTLDVNGLTSGYQGEGSKTIIPSRASAKISMRLVPNQKPGEIFKLFKAYILKIAPKGMRVTVKNLSGAEAYRAPTGQPVFSLMKRALKKVYGKEAVFAGVGGSIGFVPTMAKALGVPCVMVGFGLADENLHAPNEHFDLSNYFRGIETMALFYKELAENYAK